MLDLILATSLNAPIAQTQLLAQARAATIYLPVTVKRSTSDSDCLVYTARNNTRRKISNLRITQRGNNGRISSRSLTPSSVEPRESVSFTICDNSFINVGGNPQINQ